MNKLSKVSQFFLFVIGAIFSFFVLADQNASVQGASCIIRSGDKVVLIHEILTDKLALPGGYVEGGEHPAITAQREAWEETGLSVTVKGELLRAKNAIIFDCLSDSEIISYQHQNKFGGADLPVWFAPHYGIEVSSAMLIDPNIIDSQHYRFSYQLNQIIQLLPSATDQSMVSMANLVEAAPWLNQVEIEWMLALQQAVSDLPANISFSISKLLAFGDLFTHPFILMIVFPIVFWRFGFNVGVKLLFVVCVTSGLALIAQQGMALPRPHAYMPMLALIPSYGFGMPSLEVAVWVSVGLLLLKESGQLFWNQWLALLVFIVSWIGLSSFYTGSGFLVDALVGALLGGLCTWHLFRLEEKATVNLSNMLVSKGVWLGLVVVFAVASIMWTSATFVSGLATTVTIAGVLWLFKGTSHVSIQAAYFNRYHLLALVVAFYVMMLGFDYLLALASFSSVASLAVEALRYPLAIVFFISFVLTSAKRKEATA